MTKVNPNNGNETKLEIFPWDIFILRHIFLSKSIKIFQRLSKSKFLSFMTERNPKSSIFSWDIFKSDIMFDCSQYTKVFQLLSKLTSFNFIAKVNRNKN